MRDPVRRDPGLRVGLEAPDDQAADLLLEVRVAVGVPHDRQVRVQTGDLVGDDVEVLRGVQGHGDADPVAECLGPLPRAVHDHLGLDVAPVGPDAGHPARPTGLLGGESRDPHLLEDPDPSLTSPLGQRLGQVGRVHLAVGGQPDGAEQVVGAHHRPHRARLVRGEHPALHVVRRGVGRRPAQRHHPLLGARDDHATHLAVAGGQSGLGLQRLVQLGGVLHQPGAALGRAERAHQAGCVPRRPTGEMALFEEHHVRPARPREVVGGRRTDHPTADDHHPGTCGQVSHPSPRRAGVGSLAP